MDERIIQDLTRLRNMLSSDSQNIRTNRELYRYVMDHNLDTTPNGRVLLRDDIRNINMILIHSQRIQIINRIDNLLAESRGDGLLVLRSTDRRFL